MMKYDFGYCVSLLIVFLAALVLFRAVGI